MDDVEGQSKAEYEVGHGQAQQDSAINMDSADNATLQQALAAQGTLLGKHDETLSQLAQQLQELTLAIQQLARPVQGEVTPPAPLPPPAAGAEVQLPAPLRYDGEPGGCRGFLLQCSLAFQQAPTRFHTEQAIRGFGSVAAPLSALTRKQPGPFRWTDAAQEAFEELKRRLTSAPILHLPDPELPFEVEVDASEVGVGAILSQRSGQDQKLHPCAYFSHQLTQAERNYDVGNRELLAVKMALEEWRH
ncbi:hypothetical protein NFI96_006039 [Prochilodus magdalenae]|nr:hypothetical protein NFI96_006039 [Prochilodus magdalenae]